VTTFSTKGNCVITAAITKWEVEPGKTVDAWTYNGTVPGPTIHVQTGDKVRIHLINKLPVGNDMHIHGVKLPNNMDGVSPVTQKLVPTGGEFNYDFVASSKGVHNFEYSLALLAKARDYAEAARKVPKTVTAR